MESAAIIERINDLVDRGSLGDAIREVESLERQATVDDSQSMLLWFMLERENQRNHSSRPNPGKLDRVKERLLLAATDLALRVQQKKNHLARLPPDVGGDEGGVSANSRDMTSESIFLPRSEAGVMNSVVFLIHGIHSHGRWFLTVRRALEVERVEIVDIKYDYWDLIRFLRPWGRDYPIRKIAAEIRNAKVRHPNARLFAIAHSFGTYALMHAARDPTFELSGVILCGSVLPEDFLPERYFLQGEKRILNDCGTRDIWPVLAKCCTWGYGATGTFGMGTAYVEDRYFDFRHGDFFSSDFVDHFWKPFLTSGVVLPSPLEKLSWPRLFVILNLRVWRSVILGVLGVLAAALALTGVLVFPSILHLWNGH